MTTTTTKRQHPWLASLRRREIVVLLFVLFAGMVADIIAKERRQKYIDMGLEHALYVRDWRNAMIYLREGAIHPIWPRDYSQRHVGFLASWGRFVNNLLHPVSVQERYSDMLFNIVSRAHVHDPEAVKAAKELLDMGADPSFRQQWGAKWGTSVLDAAELSDNMECARILIAHGATRTPRRIP